MAYTSIPFQESIVSQLNDIILSDCESPQSVMVQLATGGGKTVTIAKFIRNYVDTCGKKFMVSVHRFKIVEQIRDTLQAFGLKCLIIDSDTPPVWAISDFNSYHGYVCMVQTLHRRVLNKPDYLPHPDTVGLFVWDEAHRSAANSYRDVENYYKNCPKIGLTATPIRSDGRHLSSFFGTLIKGPPVSQLIATKRLSDYEIYEVDAIPFKKLKPLIEEAKSQKTLDKNIQALLEEHDAIPKCYKLFKTYCKEGPAIVFTASKEEGKALDSFFRSKGVRSEYIDGDDSKDYRRDVDDRLIKNEIDVLVNVMLATEGYDAPNIRYLFVLRSCFTLNLWLQILGRAIRSFEGKDKALIFDFGGNLARFGGPEREHDWDGYFDGSSKPLNFFSDSIGAKYKKIDFSAKGQTVSNTGLLVSSFVETLSNQVSSPELKEALKKTAKGEISIQNLLNSLIAIRSQIPESRIIVSYLKKCSSFDSIVEKNRTVSEKGKALVREIATIRASKLVEKGKEFEFFMREYKGIPTVFELLYLSSQLGLPKQDAIQKCLSVGFSESFITEVINPYVAID